MRSCFQAPRRSSGVSDDHFLMFEYKIKTCPRRSAHDWIDCPYAHSGESARRREPHLYKPVPCPESKKGDPCPRGESCKYAHNDFEYWLHPSRYKTELCKQGPGCNRKVCFFAHQPGEIRKLSKAIMADHGNCAHGRNARRSIGQPPICASSELASAMSRLMMQNNPEWGKLQRMAELEESLQQLRAKQSLVKDNSLVNTGVNSFTNTCAFDSAPVCDNTMSNLPSMHIGPPVHLQGESQFSGYPRAQWQSYNPRDGHGLSENVCPPRCSSAHKMSSMFSAGSPAPPHPLDRYSAKLRYFGSPSPSGGYRAGCSPDLTGPLTDFIASGACSPPLNMSEHYPNLYDNVATEMRLAMERSFPRPQSSGGSLLPSLGQRMPGQHVNKPDLWSFERTESLVSPLHL